jgi:hypothetical protein
MPKQRQRLTPAVETQIVSFIRAGGYDWLAAAAAGVPPAVFQDWMRRGAKQARQPYRHFYEEVEQAKAQARLSAEIEARQKDPRYWLTHGPGREARGAPGWTMPVRALPAHEPQANVFASPELLELLLAIDDALTPFPEARAAVTQVLAGCDDSAVLLSSGPTPEGGRG